VHGEAFTVLVIWAIPITLSEPQATHELPLSFLPSPSQGSHILSTYLWVQPLPLVLVCLEVLCSPAFQRDLLFQLDQAYLEVLEVLGKRINSVSDTKSPWQQGCIR
jgi:hypothetical protein